MTALFMPLASYSQGIINTDMSGPGILCTGATSEFAVSGGGGDCFSLGTKWEIKRANGEEVLTTGYAEFTGIGKVDYVIANSQYVTVSGLSVAATSGDWVVYVAAGTQKTIRLIFDAADTYSMEATPAGLGFDKIQILYLDAAAIGFKIYYKGGSIRFCMKAKKEVLVLAPNTPLTVADNISGDRYPQCTFSGNVTYSVPAVAGATSYLWQFLPGPGGSVRGTFNGSTSITTTASSTTARFDPVNSSSLSGTLLVTAFGPCGATGSRSFSIIRTPPELAVTPETPPGGACSQCYMAPAGSNHVWSVPAGQPDAGQVFFDGPSTGQRVCLRTRNGQRMVNGYVRVDYAGGCGNAPQISTIGFALTPCGSSGRLSAEESVTESVSPNPASDVLTVTHPAQTFEVSLTDMLGKTVRRQTGTGHRHSLDVAGLPGGLYILQTRGGNQINYSQHRIVVAH